MTGYEWPPAGPSGRRSPERDDPEGRAGFLAPRRTDFAPDAALEAGRTIPVPRRRRREGPAAPAGGRQRLWLPLGPATVTRGQAIGDPRVAGRVKAIAVHPGGDRIYAAAANGGVWYSSDAGVTWRSIGGFAATNAAEIKRPAHRHACGAIHVVFGATENTDQVFVGTGETSHGRNAQPGRSLGGVGVLVATGPAASAADDPWTREAPNLLGHGVDRFAIRPGGTTVVAATSIGLLQRPDPVNPAAPWTRVAGTPFSDLEAHCTDVLWTAATGGGPERLWVWVATGGQAGLWVRAAGQTDFAKVATAGALRQRAVLAASQPPTRVYVLNDRYVRGAAVQQLPALYRIDATVAGAPTAAIVAGVPNVLGTQGFYDMAATVHPTNPNLVVVAGATFNTTNAAGTALNSDGAIVSAEVGPKAGVLTFGHTTAPQMLGVGVHADVHDVEFSNNGNRLWTSCDGGVFRSDRATQQVGFVPCNDGLATIESNYVASHPTCEGYVVAGLQDNGLVESASNGVWRHTGDGDGGGVVFDALRPDRFFRQFFDGKWTASDGTAYGSPLRRGGVLPPAAVPERDASAFYSSAASVRHQRNPGPATVAVAQLLVGTTRPWFSDDLGATWVTLPTGTDPIGAAYNGTQDAFGEPITVCKWQNPDVAWVLGEGRLQRYQRVPNSDAAGGPGSWTRAMIIRKGVKNKKDATSAEGPIRDAEVWTDVAVNLDLNGAQHGPTGSVYLGTTGHPTDDDVDTLWWFDGTETWHRTGLRNHANGVPAPVTAVLCDVDHPDEVFVGTTVGVWRGVRTLHGVDPPTWDWQPRVNGLPEAAVEDLSLFSDGGLRLLRAGIASRGVWELRLDVTDVVDLTYLRAHDDDLRYRARAVERKRDGTTPRSWHGSPDVRPRRAPSDLPPPSSLPWTRSTFPAAATDALQRFQAALRSKTGDPRCRATGVWDTYFEEVLRDHSAPVNAAQIVRIDATFWNTTMVAPHAAAEPWGAGTPTEADLYELTPALVEGDLAATSCTLPARASKVEVVVHHRGLDPMNGAQVRVTLLRWIDPRTRNRAKHDDSTTWFAGNVPWAAAVNDVLNSAAGTTGQTFGNGWAFVGSNAAARRKTLTGQTLDNIRPGIATFDLDLTGLRKDRVVLLAAVIKAGAAASAIAAAPLSFLALTDPNVAVRSIRIGG